MEFITERLILRPWKESDAEDLYQYARNPKVGPIAGWPVHTSVENSREIIRDVLSAEETYAVCLKEDGKAIGSIGLILPMQSHTKAKKDEVEIGYWIGEPFWGNGYIPEAVRALQKHAFNDLKYNGIWCGYYEGNDKSKRVQEKCGFIFHHTEYDKPCPLMGDVRTEHYTYLTKDDFTTKLMKITKREIQPVLDFYEYVIENTPDMDQYSQWKKGKYPVEEDICDYMNQGALYTLFENEFIVGALAITMKQEEDYHEILWKASLKDDEVAVIHILAVNPDYSRRGVGEKLLDEAIRIARNNGKKAIRLDAIASNQPAQHMYEKKGFQYRGKRNLYAENTGWIDFYYYEYLLHE